MSECSVLRKHAEGKKDRKTETLRKGKAAAKYLFPDSRSLIVRRFVPRREEPWLAPGTGTILSVFKDFQGGARHREDRKS